IFIIYFSFSFERQTEEIENHEQKEQIVDELNDGKENKTEAAVLQEDPVRDFLQDKIEKATNFFFTRDLQIVTLGDSLTEGVGDDTNKGGYVGILEHNLTHDEYVVEIHNFAKRGSRSTHLINKLKEDKVVQALE